MNITIRLKSELSDTESSALGVLNAAVYPPDEVGNWPGRLLEWSPRLISVIVWNEDQSQAVTHAGIVLRDARLNDMPVRIGGIGGVMRHPALRRQGFCAAAIAQCINFFREQGDIYFGLLVCEGPLIPFYERLGWRLFPGELLVRQHGQQETFTFLQTMTLPINSSQNPSGVIDLMGPPW